MSEIEKQPEEERNQGQIPLFSLMQQNNYHIPDSLTPKVTSEHITTIIENSDKKDQRDYDFQMAELALEEKRMAYEEKKISTERGQIIIFFIGIIILFVFLTFTIKDSHPDTYNNILTHGMTGILALAGGYGYGRFKSSKQ